MLDEVANILKEYPDYNLRIGGMQMELRKTQVLFLRLVPML
jgi:hypothetical protein